MCAKASKPNQGRAIESLHSDYSNNASAADDIGGVPAQPFCETFRARQQGFDPNGFQTQLNRIGVHRVDCVFMKAIIKAIASDTAFLPGLAIAILTFAMMPADPPRQEFTWTDPSGNTQLYSLALDDPRLDELNTQLRVWRGEWPTTKLSLAKWRREIADFYAQSIRDSKSSDPANTATEATEPTSPSDDESGTVVQVSFSSNSETETVAVEPIEAAISPARADYWRFVRDQTAQVVLSEEAKLRKRRSGAAQPPVTFLRIVDDHRGLRSYIAAAVAGLLTVGLFCMWSIASPVRRLSTAILAEPVLDADSTAEGGALRIEIPSQWVRINQTRSVILRRATCSLLVLAALASFLH